MTYLNVTYTALMLGRNTDHPWGRRQSPDAAISNEPVRITDAAELLIPASYADREAAAMAEQYVGMWSRASTDPALTDLDPKNTYGASLLDQFTHDELKLFNPSQIIYRLSGKISFKDYPSLRESFADEIYWVDRLSAAVAYVVSGRIRH